MWIPQKVDELEAAVEAGALEETSTLEGKEEPLNNSKKLAKQVAALANDGGVLIFGVGEDDNGRLTKLTAFELSGEAERIAQIVQTCIAEPPQIEIKELWKKEEESNKGYLVVVVPASPRAPHMVIKSGDNRYYGRGAKGVRRLSEGDVARLYGRREKWDIDRDTWMQQIIENAPREPAEEFGFLSAAVRPVVQSESFIESRLGTSGDVIKEVLRSEIDSLLQSTVRVRYQPKLSSRRWEATIDGWFCEMSPHYEKGSDQDLRGTLNIYVSRNGEARMFCSSAARMHKHGLCLVDKLICDLPYRLITFAKSLYARCAYVGPLDAGIALSGVQGSGLFAELRRPFEGKNSRRMQKNEYVFTQRLARTEDPEEVVSRLLNPLFAGLSDGRVKPFDYPKR